MPENLIQPSTVETEAVERVLREALPDGGVVEPRGYFRALAVACIEAAKDARFAEFAPECVREAPVLPLVKTPTIRLATYRGEIADPLDPGKRDAEIIEEKIAAIERGEVDSGRLDYFVAQRAAIERVPDPGRLRAVPDPLDAALGEGRR